MSNRASKPTKARVWRLIDEKCRDCIYDEFQPGSWVQQVGACEITDCPLWEIRRISVPSVQPEAPTDERPWNLEPQR